MIVENINKTTHRPRVLVVPLDWGLGHATRCIPIINVLNGHNTEVLIAAEGAVAKLLQKEFPSIVILPLKGYKISYSRGRQFFLLKMLMQFPRVINSILHEKKWLNNAITQHKIDAVISDNRFGLYSAKATCVYVTHQLFIETGNSFLNKIAQRINYYFINKFDECWVPDAAGIKNFAGKLSHPIKLPVKPVKYLGIVSRCKKIITAKKYDLLVLLSGPEPQRSLFEELILSQLKDMEGIIVLVRGLPGNEKNIIKGNDKLTVHDHLPAEALNELIQQSTDIVARCGYSTVMDLAVLQQKAILVPTPGQTEQEYLARYLMEKKIFFTCPQENFVLQQALEANKLFNTNAAEQVKGLDEGLIIQWIEKTFKKLKPLQ